MNDTRFRAKVGDDEITVSVSDDGSVWTHRLGRKPAMLASSRDSYLWLLGHVIAEQLADVKKLKPKLCRDLMQSHMAG